MEQPATQQPQPKPETKTSEPKKDRNIVYVGKKETMAYVLAVVTQFNQGSQEVHLKARGRSINKAVDISQIVKNRFVPTLTIKNVDIATEELTSEDGSVNKVSSMDILVRK
ncbi:DNA-binding protein Alba [Candidatus Micrarchaeota archaeon]|nr:DNA-binding protein Alba [Candidatus Micrarchaeota archaeon]